MLRYYVKHDRSSENDGEPRWCEGVPREVAMACMAGGRYEHKPGGWRAAWKRAEWRAKNYGDADVDGSHFSRITIVKVA